MRREEKINVNLYYAVLFAVFVVFTAMYWLHPRTCDDWDYTPEFGKITFWWQSVCDIVEWIYLNGNARLSNMIAPIFLSLPWGLSAIMLGICLVWLILESAKLAQVWKRDFCGFAVLVSLYCIFFPWSDLMFVRDFALNYLVTSLIMVIAIRRWFSVKKKKIIPLFLLGLLLGVWHEAFAGPFLVSAFCIMILYKRFRKPPYFAMAIGVALGIAWLCTCPRAVADPRYEFGFGLTGFYNWRHIIWGIVFCCWCAVCVFFRQWRRTHRLPIYFFLCASILSSMMIWNVICFVGPRVGTAGIVLGFIGVAMLITDMSKISTRRGSVIIGGILCAIAIAQNTFCIPWFNAFNNQTECAQTSHNTDTHRYIPLLTIEVQPWYTLLKPRLGWVNMNLYDPSGILFPIEFLEFTPDKAQQVAEDVYLYKGYLICTAQHSENLWFTTDGEPTHCTESTPREFEVAGKKYWWYMMDYSDKHYNAEYVEFRAN